MFKSFWSVVAGGLLLTGCAQKQWVPLPPAIKLPAFDASDARRLLGDGVNAIRGSAFLRQQGGGVVTCAGATVYLIPATEYARQRLLAIYGSESGPARTPSTSGLAFDPDPPEYKTLVRQTQCDAQGTFSFDRVGDGDYFVTTAVIWTVAARQQGGLVMRRTRVSGGQGVNLVIAPT